MSRTSRKTARRGDAELLAALRAGDDAAFAGLVRAHHAVLVALAGTYVSSRAVAEEVVLETWLRVLTDLDRFAARSSPKASIVRTAASIARRRAVRERRGHPSAALAGDALAGDEPAVEAGRFHPRGHPHAGHWARPPVAWQAPAGSLLSSETRHVVRAAIAQLPAAQRLVLTMRDVEGWSAEETCEALEMTARAQRALLHRGRCAVRDALERHVRPVESAA